MAICRRKTFIVFIIVSLIYPTYEEIHRARTNTPKSSAKSAFSYVADSETEKLDIASEKGPPLGGYKNTMYDVKSEIWCYSIFSAGLVGLSGIFPLLVIPIEAGPALKHGKNDAMANSADPNQSPLIWVFTVFKEAAARLKLLLSFAVGGLLGDVFLHLLPEAWAHIDKDGEHNHDAHTTTGLWVIMGLLSFLIIEKMFAKENEFEHLQDECEEAEQEERAEMEQISRNLQNRKKHTQDTVASRTRQKSKSKQNGVKNNSAINNNSFTKKISSPVAKEKKSTDSPVKEKNTIKVSGYLNLAANVIDNFTHGLAVAAGFLVSNKVGVLTTTAILLHEIPHEVGDFAILLRSGFDRWKAAKAQLLTATGGMIGALTALTADSAQEAGDSTAWILPFTSGGFIYIALVTVVPDLLAETHPRESTKQVLCLLAGIGAMYLVSLVH